MFGLQYSAPTDWDGLKNTVQQFWHNQHGTLVVELFIESDEGARTLQQLLSVAAEL